MARRILALVLAIGASSCVTEESALINRRYLLDPTMDPAKTSPLAKSLLDSTYSNFDVSAQAGQSTMSGACPTCGG